MPESHERSDDPSAHDDDELVELLRALVDPVPPAVVAAAYDAFGDAT